ncbi:MAG: hypothetical protein AAF572_09495 [Cyanobacteria bacterium P01_B01_bin.77]
MKATQNIDASAQSNDSGISHLQTDIPVVPTTPTSAVGSDLFYIIIALAICMKLTIEAIASLVQVILKHHPSGKQ